MNYNIVEILYSSRSKSMGFTDDLTLAKQHAEQHSRITGSRVEVQDERGKTLHVVHIWTDPDY